MAKGVTLTGFSTADLLEMAGHDHVTLAGFAKALAAAGLAAVAETPIDRLGDTDEASEVVRAVRHGGLGVWRLTVDRVSPDNRLTLIARADALAADVGGILAFAPLSRRDLGDVPSTGYDDVKTVAIARVMCRSIPSIQVDWALYGPKLAQVASAYGADDLDAVSPYDDPAAGARRAPRAEIERHIRAAYAEPAERGATYEILP
jgi:aminodeoxyfutalosine synthase